MNITNTVVNHVPPLEGGSAVHVGEEGTGQWESEGDHITTPLTKVIL